MTTKIADIIEPEVFNPYFTQRTAELAKFYMGGIVSDDTSLNVLASAGGRTVTMPFFEDLTGADELLSDSAALTPAKITSGTDVARLHMRGKAWGVNDLSKAIAVNRADPMGAIADLAAEYWARRYQAVLMASIAGVLADNEANDDGDMVAGDVTAAFDADMFVDGQATFGDVTGALSGIAFHPTVYHGLKKTDNISFEKESLGALEVETYRGLRVIVDRSLPSNAGAEGATGYVSVLFGAGAIGMGQGAAPVPSETDRDSLAGEDFLITRTHFLMHPRGIKWNDASVAAQTPSNAEIALPANWTRVYEREQVRIAFIKSVS